ncbi:hypothetical protein LQ327_30335 [Actinomycetospora endophytica]|uniref:Uncharacterized protein n=1 Tax=Actinomycetospora endophytica TaxID=2291215 RepID=A0ABS8PL23_9PSEU|nr:hypothetical protein [Actinomycetospora endophytica]MCD2197679.1 hypothetical protein [Actinomycetospora endophytica]
MPNPEEYEAVYYRAREGILGRHFAVGTRARVNLENEFNNLRRTDDTPDANPTGQGAPHRWNIQAHGRDNPLLWSGRLLATMAAEYALGNQKAERVITLALDTFEELFTFRSGNQFDGYILRWDPVASDSWTNEAGWSYSNEFLVDQTSGGYIYSVPARDPRHTAYRPESVLSRLLTDSQKSEYLANFADYTQSFRLWEPSQDELVGLVGAYAVVYDLVPIDGIRERVTAQIQRLAEYLASSGYLLVRPAGGITFRGAADTLPAFELPFNELFERILGERYPNKLDFVGGMLAAGYWPVLAGPVEREEVLISLGGIVLGPALASLIAPLLIVAGAPDLLVALLAPLAQAGQLPVWAGVVAPYVLPALPRALALNNHTDCFDVSSDREVRAPITSSILLAIPPSERFEATMDILAVAPDSMNAKSFVPFLGLTAIGDRGGQVSRAYLRTMSKERNKPLQLGKTDALQSCFASALALVLGAGETEEQRFVALLQHHYGTLLDSGGQDGLVVSDQPKDQGLPYEQVDPGLDYVAGISLAWLYARRQADAGTPVRTLGFPRPPDPATVWPDVTISAEVLGAVPGLRQALGATQLPPEQDVDLFDPETADRQTTPTPMVKSTSSQVVIQDITMPVRYEDGDAPTGIVIRRGDQFEITAEGRLRLAGVIDSGPEGLDLVDDARFALHLGLDPFHAFRWALLGRLGGYFYVGTHRPLERWLYPRPRPLYLRVNSSGQTGPRGDGAYQARVVVWGDPLGCVKVIDIQVGGELTDLARLGAAFEEGDVSTVDLLVERGVGVLGNIYFTEENRNTAAYVDVADKIRSIIKTRKFIGDEPAIELWVAAGGKGDSNLAKQRGREISTLLLRQVGLPNLPDPFPPARESGFANATTTRLFIRSSL